MQYSFSQHNTEKTTVVNGVEVTTMEYTSDPEKKVWWRIFIRADTYTNTAHKKPGGVEYTGQTLRKREN